MLRKIFLFLLLFNFCTAVFAQLTGNMHTKKIVLTSDTLKLDTLSLIPNSVQLTINNTLLDTLFYKINYVDGLLIFNQKKLKESNIVLDSLKATYKTFPFLFSSETKHKDASSIRPDLQGNANPFSYNIESKNDDIFKMDGLNKSGSISRGITFGNNQDMVVNSNLNLQLSGHLSNNVDILLAATDNNIPIQPEGNTQQLQEFDKVFIQLSTANTKLIAGDFVLKRPTSYFMNFNKKAQGASFSTAVRTNKNNKEKQGLYSTTLSAAVSRGKFARNQIQGIENNQGPYRLRGAENETFIIILSGTEKVYIDGRLIERGQENDYIINYNTGEIVFTAKQLITKDKRIVVEFQYSDKNYARSLIHFGNDYEQNNLKLHLNIYSEQDSKNQPLQQSLSDDQKRLLSRIGDTLSLAVSPSIENIPFNNNEVLYAKTDSTIGLHTFEKIFIYSPQKIYMRNGVIDSAHFRVNYSNVGQGNGNYIQINSSANGKVFQWIMPDTSVIPNKPMGSYEPVIQLITPKTKQMLTAGIEYNLTKNSKLAIEGAVSNNDINTFSSANTNDDVGYALKTTFENTQKLFKTKSKDSISRSLNLITNMNYEYVQKYFSPIERYRTIEFERDWNKSNTTTTPNDQHIIGGGVALIQKGVGAVGYNFNAFLEGSQYNANKHNANINFSNKGFNIKYDGSLLNSLSTQNTNFYRHKSFISQDIKGFVLGLKDEFEQNKFSTKKDSLLPSSYQFWEWQAFVQNKDSTKNKYGLFYKNRTDFATKNAMLLQSAYAESFGGFLELIKNQNSQLKINTAYRRLNVNSALTSQTPDNSLVGRIEYNLKLFKGLIYSNSFYEIGSGLEVKKQYSYIEVAAGQGIYTWVDYNKNNIKELNEFEIATFADQATYIKIYTPTNDYIKTYSNQFSEVLMLKPSAVWMNKTGIKKFLTHFSNQTSYRIDRKSTDNKLEDAYNPFLIISNDTSNTAFKTLVTLNSSFRNTLFINQLSPTFGLDLTYQDVRNKSLLVNGFDSRINTYEEIRLRWNITQKINWTLIYKNGNKGSQSQYFGSRNYFIKYFEAEPKFNFQPNTIFRASISFKYTDKKNSSEFGGQHAIIQDYGAELKYNVLNKGSLNVKANFIQITYNDLTNSSITFEMLDALKTGRNITWGLAYQRNLSNNLQLSITYDGRNSEGGKTIHTGGAQVRAYF